MEVWKDIDGYDGDYQISNFGRVISYKHKKKYLTIRKNVYGYTLVSLSKNAKAKGKRIHRLMAQAFIPNPENKPQINHINCIKDDNRLENLEWCTASENMIHAFKNGLLNNETTKETIKKIIISKTILVFNGHEANKIIMFNKQKKPIMCFYSIGHAEQEVERLRKKKSYKTNIWRALKRERSNYKGIAYGYYWEYAQN